MADQPILKVVDIRKTYGSLVKTEVLHGINFSVTKGEFTSIIGYSGSGKSTLLNLLGALDSPTSGHIIYEDQALDELSQDELAVFRNENIGFIFQFHHLLPEFSALENVLVPTWIKKGKSSGQDLGYAKELLELVGLKDYMNNKSSNLSGGQQQRVAIARSLINHPKIIYGDEPTGNLDNETTQSIYGLFRNINKNLDTTMIMVTHNDEIAGKSDRIIKLSDGNIVKDTININETIRKDRNEENT